ncbi:MAG: TIGR01777 family oxidoreductase [Planctomycetota bacterium]|nr:TIGR01777 family oxidoreductase [Planctomycetota bacterium]
MHSQLFHTGFMIPIPMPKFDSKVQIDAPREYVFSWHECRCAFDRLVPPWEQVVVVRKEGGIENGTVTLKTRAAPLFWFQAKASHSQFVRNEQFYDEMSGGPFSNWQHTHRFLKKGDNSTLLHDEVVYRLRGGWLGNWLGGGYAHGKLEQLFAYRREVTRSDTQDHFQFASSGTRTIAVSGANGLIGSRLCSFLDGGGHRIIKLKRFDTDQFEGPGWNPATGKISFGEAGESVDCLIHLAGHGIAENRWNNRVKQLIRSSRCEATEKLCDYLGRHPGLVRESFVCASATGFYGNRGDEILDESSAAGEGFLPETCVDWEAATRRVDALGLRRVNLRFGIILSLRGGALPKLVTPSRFFLGGRFGSGRQFWSWISLLDTLRAIHYSVMEPNLQGPVNLVAPEPVRQSDFSRTLGKVLFRPSLGYAPGFLLKLVAGEMAGPLLLEGTRVRPKKLTDHGFHFVHNRLEDALRFELGKIRIENHDKDQ